MVLASARDSHIEAFYRIINRESGVFPGKQIAAWRPGVEVDDHPVDQTRYISEQTAVVFEKHAEGLWDGEHELAVRQVEKHVFGEMFGEEQRPLLMT